MPSPRTEVYEDDLDKDVAVGDVVDEDDVRVFLTPAGEFTLRLIDLCARALPLLVTRQGGDSQERFALAADIRAALHCGDQ